MGFGEDSHFRIHSGGELENFTKQSAFESQKKNFECCRQVLESSSSGRREFLKGGFLIVGERSLKGVVPSFIRRRLGPSGVQPAFRSTTLHRGFLSVFWNKPTAVYVCLSQTPKTIDSNPRKRNPIGEFLVEFRLICLLSNFVLVYVRESCPCQEKYPE
jgi:hypothetical protein